MHLAPRSLCHLRCPAPAPRKKSRGNLPPRPDNRFPLAASSLTLTEGSQELLVALRAGESREQHLHGLGSVHVRDDLAQQPHLGERAFAEEQVLTPRARLEDVDSREDAALLEATGEVKLHVAGTLELLEDHVVHARTGLHQRGSKDRERTTAANVPGGTEEALGPVQRAGIETAREGTAGRRRHEVVRAGEPGDRVEQDHHVTAVLHDAPGALMHELCDADVVGGRLIEGRGDDFHALHRLPEVGDLLRPLVHEQHDDLDVRFVRDHGVRDRLEECRLTGLGRGHDEPALTAANGGEQVDYPGRELILGRLQLYALFGEGGDEVVEARALGGLERVDPVDGLNPDQGSVALVVTRTAGLAHDHVASPEPELLDQTGRDNHLTRIVLQQRLLQEPITVRGDLQVAGYQLQALGFRGALEDGDDEFVLGHLAVVLEANLLGEEVQLGDYLRLEVTEVKALLTGVATPATAPATRAAPVLAVGSCFGIGVIVRVTCGAICRGAGSVGLLLVRFLLGQGFLRVTDLLGRFLDRKSTRLNSSHVAPSYAVFWL